MKTLLRRIKGPTGNPVRRQGAMERPERSSRTLLICSSLAPLVLACAASEPLPEHVEVGPDHLFHLSEGTGRPVVFVNGGSMDLRQWDGQVEAFAKEYRVVRFDHRGWGRSSSISESFSPVEDLAALIDELELEDVVLVGCSFGGGVALDYTLEYPERPIAALVLVAPAVSGYPWSEEFLDRSARMAAARAEGGVDGHVAVILEDPHFLPGASANPELAARANELLRANYPLYSNDFTHLEQTEPPAYWRLEDVATPTLLIAPELDVPEVLEVIATLDERLPDSTRADIPGAGHMVQMERPEEVNAAIIAFLKGLGR